MRNRITEQGSSLASVLMLLALMVCGLSVSSCDDEISTSSSDQPYFSADTVQMGQLLAGNSSKTYQIHIINPCSKEIRLSSVVMRGGAESGFRMNVDGMNGTSFTDANLLRIAAHDSMYVFVEATFPENGELLTQHTGYIDVTCNGVTQSVVLMAQSKDVQKYHGLVLEEDAVWKRTCEYLVYDSLVIAPGATLTLEDSVTLYLHDKAKVIVQGTLLCKGTLDGLVTIRGDRTDNMFENLPYDNLPSQWGALYIDSTATGCRFDYTDIHGMTEGICIDSTDVTFNGCRIKNSGSHLITCRMSTVTMQNCELSNAAGALYEAYGGWHEMNHCTLANYNFAAAIAQRALHFSNVYPEVGYTPLYQMNVTNTIVWGDTYNPDVYPEYYQVIVGTDALGLDIYADSIFSYRFDHCLLRAKGEDDADFIETIWDEDPLYQLIDDDNYTYDFHLTAESPAREKGVATSLKIDREGVERTAVPSIGCYEYVKKE